MPSVVNSPRTLRQQQADHTRALVLDAAAAAFVGNGFAGARIEDIASAAGVAVPTVYKTFKNKRRLLAEVVDRSMTGGATGGVEEQDWWQEQLEAPDPAEQLRLIARNARRIYARSGHLLDVVRAAAPLDREIADMWETITGDRFERGRRSARALLRKAGDDAAMGVDDTALTLVSLTAPELYTTVTSAGRSAAEYERWLARVLTSSLLVRS